MKIGIYQVKKDKLEEFNNAFFNYNDDLKEMLFDFHDISRTSGETSYKIFFYTKDNNFKDHINKFVKNKKWFEGFFIPYNIY